MMTMFCDIVMLMVCGDYFHLAVQSASLFIVQKAGNAVK